VRAAGGQAVEGHVEAELQHAAPPTKKNLLRSLLSLWLPLLLCHHRLLLRCCCYWILIMRVANAVWWRDERDRERRG
jgi:hypothetical protein